MPLRQLLQKLGLLLLTVMMSAALQAAPPSLTPSATASSISLAPYLELLEDPTKQLGIAQVSSAAYSHRFVPNTAAVPDFGHSRSVWWVRFQLHSEQAQEWYLLLDRPIGGIAEAFLSSGTQSHLQHVDDFRLPAWHLQLAPQDTVTVYVKAYNSKALLSLPLKLLTANALLTSGNQATGLFMALCTGMGVLILYNLLQYCSLREKDLLYLGIFLTTTNLLFLRDSYLLPVAWLTNPTNYFYSVPFLLCAMAGFHYWRSVNRGENLMLEQLGIWIPRLSLAALPLSGLYYTEQFFYGLLLALDPFFVILMLHIIMTHKTQYIRLVAWATLLIAFSVTPYLTMQCEWVSYNTDFILLAQMGILLASLLLSFAQAEQTHLLREEKESMEAASKAKDSFLTTMSHELRTPIHAVLGVTDLLRQTALSVEQTAYLDKLSASSRHLQSLVNDVLDLSRIGAGKLELETTDFRLDEELDTLRQIFSLSAAQKGLALSITHDIPANALVRGDPVRLKQVLVNLLGNALKFTVQGHVSLSVQQIAGNAGQIRLYFEVVDTGIGISIHHQHRLFQSFSQAESSTARRYGGTGLGLAISHKLVGLMGGKLEVDSEPENGSRFFFTLEFPVNSPPKTLTPQPPLPEVEREQESGRDGRGIGICAGIHILVVDDDELNRYLAIKMLAQLGIKVTVVDSGQAALAQLQQQTFDLVMMDVSMPDMDGYTTTRHIRNAGFTDLPIIAVTAHVIEGERERCQAAGMDDYLGKPFGMDALHTVLAKHLENVTAM